LIVSKPNKISLPGLAVIVGERGDEKILPPGAGYPNYAIG